MARKAAKPKSPPASRDASRDGEVIDGMLRDIDGLMRLQKFQMQLLDELRRSLLSIQKDQ